MKMEFLNQEIVIVKKEENLSEMTDCSIQIPVFHSSHEAQTVFNIKAEVEEKPLTSEEFKIPDLGICSSSQEYLTPTKMSKQKEKEDKIMAQLQVWKQSKGNSNFNGRNGDRYWNDMAANVSSLSCEYPYTKTVVIAKNSPERDVKGYLKCQICSKTYSHSGNYSQHVKVCVKRHQLFKNKKYDGDVSPLSKEGSNFLNTDKINQNLKQSSNVDCPSWPWTQPQKLNFVLNERYKTDDMDRSHYKCQICKKTVSYVRGRSYNSHLKSCKHRLELAKREIDVQLMDDKLSILQCPFCDKRYEREVSYNQHVDLCTKMNLKMQDKDKLVMETEEKTNSNPRSSQSWKICDSIPTDNKLIKLEVESESHFTTTTENSVDSIRQSGPSLKCRDCPKRFLEIESLDAHIATAHSNEVRKLDDSSDDEELIIPQKINHRKLKCPYCTQTYGMKAKRHYRNHKALCKKKQRKMNGEFRMHTDSIDDELKRIMP